MNDVQPSQPDVLAADRIVQINEEQIRGHLDRMVVQSVEESKRLIQTI